MGSAGRRASEGGQGPDHVKKLAPKEASKGAHKGPFQGSSESVRKGHAQVKCRPLWQIQAGWGRSTPGCGISRQTQTPWVIISRS